MKYKNINELNEIIQTLRGENGCPWDRKQTPKSIAVYLVEEAHELMHAVENGNSDEICEELGDVLFQVLFIARMFQEKGTFDLEDAARGCAEKMIRRHPHVFGDATVSSAEEVRQQWQQIKRTEKDAGAENASVLDSVPAKLPPLMRAYRISERAARTDFDWDDIQGVMAKAEEEWGEFRAEVRQDEDGNNREKVALEFGDLLFTLTNVARFARIHPDSALTSATHKFEERFRRMEQVARETGRTIYDMPRDEKERLWDAAKALEAVGSEQLSVNRKGPDEDEGGR
ncbi:nucleoside triphosphate pyrophosphohydrolase [Desulfonema ishimotonii]|uniref:Nucleoside triphosphate pyrophosphohydrolase n=1 Tax=Desulfonema ishimotonii TaxID=45657 RepID=A0A401G3E2_9BACT|nr:nucleoside triphosphate pyrophosphohydrolase [Desulfonema ishimotonii]GBC63713.1 nucleoside triphosphate pyrophosphohydrolase [Desulfonema ishimotonii]